MFSFLSKLLRGQDTSDKASDKILIKSASICDETEEITESLIIIAENKTDIARAITSCLEKPIHQILQHWSTGLKTEGLGKRTSRVIAEIKAIRKELVLDEQKRTTAATDLFPNKCKTCVPDDLKDYLFGYVFHTSLGTPIFKINYLFFAPCLLFSLIIVCSTKQNIILSSNEFYTVSI